MFQKLPNLQFPDPESTTPASSAPTEAPAAATVTPAETPADNAGDSTPVDWAAISDDSNDGFGGEPDPAPSTEPARVETPISAAPASTLAPAPVAAPTPPAQTPQAAAPITPAAVAAPAVTPAPAVTAPAPVAAAAPVKTPEQLTAERTAAVEAERVESEKQFNGLVEYYKLSDDLAMKASTEPELVLPLIAAKLHQTIARNLVQTIQNVLPQVVQGVQINQGKEVEAKNAFYGRWPNLVGREKEVIQVGTMFRQINPTATAQEAIERIGKTVCEAFGIDAGAGAAVASVTAPKPAAPVFTPSGGGSGARSAAPTADNLYAKLADELLLEDQG